MPITRPAPATTIAYAEINDDLLIDTRVTVPALTPAEAIAYAAELTAAAHEALAYAHQEPSA